jgi:uncharacterized protein YdbL (DUF1318 family)
MDLATFFASERIARPITILFGRGFTTIHLFCIVYDRLVDRVDTVIREGIRMNYLIKRTGFIFSFLFIMHSCVTINIYFPAAAVERAADKIVEEVWGEQEGEQQGGQQQGEPESFLYQERRFALLGPAEAFAEEADINVTTPAIRTLKESIKKRADALKPFLDRGNAGLSNDGLVLVRTAEGLSLKDKAMLTRLVEAENNDRNTLYREIAKANNFPPEKVTDIKKIFAGSWIKQARKGWWVQNPDGAWSRKE